MVILAMGTPVTSMANPAEAALRQFAESVNQIEAKFLQTQLDEFGDLISSGSGEMAISRPGKFRWHYRDPFEQLMVCDGQRIWVYDPDLSQVTVRSAGSALAGTPAELLAGNADLTRNFEVEDIGKADAVQHVRLKPREQGGDFESIELWLESGVPSRLKFADPLGGFTDISLHDVRVNGDPNGANFEFVPPKGVEVVGSPEDP